MARFDVYRERQGRGLLLDCQADLLGHLNTRFCVPLMSPEDAPLAGARLNPDFQVAEEQVRMVTQFAAAVPVRDLSAVIGNLSDEQSTIMNALDMLTSGY